MSASGNKHHEDDRGFTLVELLIVIVILGILATITVFAVRGITETGESATMAADAKTIAHAQEAYMALNDTYGTETDLVAAEFLRDHSILHDINLIGGGTDYELVAEGTGTTTTVAAPPTTVAAPPTTVAAPPTTVATPPTTAATTGWIDGDVVTTTFAGFVAEQYGNGPEIAFLLGRNPDTQSDWNWFTSNSPALAGWTLYNVTDPELDTSAELLAAHGQADFTLYRFSESVAEGPAAQILKTAEGGLWAAPANHAATYWSWRNAPGASITDFQAFLAAQRNDGAPIGFATTTPLGYSAWKSTASSANPVVVIVGDPSIRAGYEAFLQAQTNLQFNEPILYIEDSDLNTAAEASTLDTTTPVTIYLPQALYDLWLAAHPGGQNDVQPWTPADLQFII